MSEPEKLREDESGRRAGETSGRGRFVGIALMAVAVFMWIGAAVVFFLPLPGGQKVWITSVLLVGGEVFFWISAAVLGREVFRRYRGRLDPRRLFRKNDR